MADKTNTSLANYFLNQLMNQQNYIGKEQYNFGRDTLQGSVGDIKYLQDFFKNVLEGKDTGKLLDFLNPDEINKNYDQAVQTASELSPRGGLRTSVLGNLDFAKMGDVQNLLQEVRSKSPEALTQLAGLLATIGAGSVGAGENAFGQNLQAVLGQLGLNEGDKNRKTELIGGIISAIGSAAGALACVTGETIVVSSDGDKLAANVEWGDKLLGSNGEFRPVIRIRTEAKQETAIITTEEQSKLECTLSHVLVDEGNHEAFVGKMFAGTRLLNRYGNIETVKSIQYNQPLVTVYMFKLQDENDNYNYITNNFVSIDDDKR